MQPREEVPERDHHRVLSASCIRLFVSLCSKELVIHLWTKAPCGTLGSLGEVLPTCVSGSRQVYFGKDYETSGAVGLPGALLPWLRKYPETADLARYPPTREELQKTSLPKGRCQHTAGAINTSEFVSTGDGKKFTSVLPTLGNTAWGQIIRWQRPVPREKVSECLATLLLQVTAGETCFFTVTPRELRWTSMTGRRREETGRETGRNIKGH